MTTATRLQAAAKINSAKTSAVSAVKRDPPPSADVSPSPDRPDTAVQLDHAARFGHHFEDINIFRPDQPIQRTIQPEPLPSTAPESTPNRTGLPDQIKAGIELLSGMDLSDVRVHADSAQPARIGALAYTQGDQIHVAPGQKRHLPHEAWHVVQQRQGRVRPTLQAKGVAINDDEGLEREADQMGAQALSSAQAAVRNPVDRRRKSNGAYPSRPIVQGVFDWAEDLANNKRKVGVEITEANTNNNRLYEAYPNAAWALLGAGGQTALWTHTVNLPDAAGAGHVWQVAAENTMNTYFDYAGSKHTWMKWDSILMTEDYGEFEWIIRHPNAPMEITYYRDQLANVNRSRVAMRNALAAIPGNPHIVSLNQHPGANDAFVVNIQAVNAASSQITFESTDREQTKKALLEGLTHGLNRRAAPDRAMLVDPDADIAAAVTTVANHVVVANVDRELIAAFIIGDLCHKMATLITGANWAANAIAANFKQWRTLFPKSHPSQITLQAMDNPPTPTNIGAIGAAFIGQRAAIINDITELFARKMSTARVEWPAARRARLPGTEGAGDPGDPGDPGVFTAATDPHDHVLHGLSGVLPAANLGAGVVGGIPTLQASLVVFLNANGINLVTEFNDAIAALVDYTGVATNVVRSTGFATHAGSNKGFAFEDRAEVATQFPELATTYARIKAVVNRY